MVQEAISLKTDRLFYVNVNGNEKSGKMIILVHGFGVKSDSRGLFTEIEDALKNDFLVIRPDFADMQGDFIKVIPISEQVKRFRCVMSHVKNRYKTAKLIFIGHSQGCIVTAKARPKNSLIFLLAPPIKEVFWNFVNSDGWKRKNSSLNMQGESRLTRSDGTLTLVNSDFWTDFKMIDATKEYLELGKSNNVYLVMAGEDHVLGKQVLPDDMKGFSIDKANHDFKGKSRSDLINKLWEKIKIDL